MPDKIEEAAIAKPSAKENFQPFSIPVVITPLTALKPTFINPVATGPNPGTTHNAPETAPNKPSIAATPQFICPSLKTACDTADETNETAKPMSAANRNTKNAWPLGSTFITGLFPQ